MKGSISRRPVSFLSRTHCVIARVIIDDIDFGEPLGHPIRDAVQYTVDVPLGVVGDDQNSNAIFFQGSPGEFINLRHQTISEERKDSLQLLSEWITRLTQNLTSSLRF